MSKIIIDKSLYTDIANTLRSEKIISGSIYPSEMADKVSELLTQSPDYEISNDGSTITLSNNVTKINQFFLGTDLNTSSSVAVNIPISNRIKEIDYMAFINCKGLPESIALQYIEKIDDYAFYGSNIKSLEISPLGSDLMTTTLGLGSLGITNNLQFVLLDNCLGAYNVFMMGAPKLKSLMISGDNSYCPTGFLQSYYITSANACCPSLVEIILKGGTFETQCFDDYASTAQAKMFISKNVKEIQDYAFCIGKNLMIYTDATTTPEGWSENWYKYVDINTGVEISNSVFYGVDYIDYLAYVLD